MRFLSSNHPLPAPEVLLKVVMQVIPALPQCSVHFSSIQSDSVKAEKYRIQFVQYVPQHGEIAVRYPLIIITRIGVLIFKYVVEKFLAIFTQILLDQPCQNVQPVILMKNQFCGAIL